MFKRKRPAISTAALGCRRPLRFSQKPCRLLQAYDQINKISFLIDTGSVISTIKANKREFVKKPDDKVLYSATANEILTFGESFLSVNFNTPHNYEWKFTKTDLNFSIIGLDFLIAHNLVVDPFNRCLIDKGNGITIPLKPARITPPKLCCVLPEKSEFHSILAKYPKILNPPHRFKRVKHGIEHSINTNGNIVKSKLRRTSPETQKVIDEQIDEWLREGIVFRSDSPYASCLHVVPRKSGKPRVCVDYRNLNAISLLKSYPIPHIHSMLDNLYGSKIFSVLDLKSAYFNVPVREQDKCKTAFIVKNGCYAFNYLPFGLKSAPATFMHFIHEVLYSQIPSLKNFTEVYLDDILIHTPDIQSHKEILDQVCQCLSKFNLGINLSKCVLGQSSINYLGFSINSHGYTATNEKVKAIIDFPLPRTVRQLSRFCGMINFYHRAIKNCSGLLKPLYDIFHHNRKKPKSTPIEWTDAQKDAFTSVKNALSQKTVLSFPIPNAPTFLATDASDSTIAATLFQFDSAKNCRVPIAFYSKNLQKAQLNYSIFDKEILAIYMSIKHFQFMLECRNFKILCDNQAVVKSITKPNLDNMSARVRRHLQFISQYSTDLEYIESKQNFVADTLTRSGILLVSDLPDALNYEEIAQAQQSDPEIQSYLSQISSLQFKNLPLEGSCETILCDVSQSDTRVVLPKQFRRKAFEHVHFLNHAGIKSTNYMLKQRFIWPNMNKDIKDWVSQCHKCQSIKTKRHTYTPIARFPPSNQAFEDLHLDLIGPLPPARGYHYILTITDRFTKGSFAIAIPDCKSDTIATYFLNQYIALFGVPKTIVTDNASYFSSYSWSKFMSFLNVKQKFITPYHCQANGMVERFNRYLRTALRCHDKSESWFDHLGLALLGMNSSYNEDLKMSRAERLFGKKLRLPSSFFEQTPQVSYNDPDFLKSLLSFFNNREQAPINSQKSYRKTFIDKNLLNCSAVYMRVDRVKKGLEPSFTGPFKVLQKFDKYFTLETSRGNKNVSLDRLKPAYTTPLDNLSSDNQTKLINQHCFAESSVDNNSLIGNSVNSDSPSSPSDKNPSTPTSISPSLNDNVIKLPTCHPVPKPRSRSGRTIKPPVRLNI